MGKTKPIFITFLAWVSILGFLAVALNNFKIIDINSMISNTIFILLGTGLMFEAGLVRLIFKRMVDRDLSKVFTMVIGLGVVITGIVSFFGIVNDTFMTIKGIAAVMAMIAVILETWVVN